MAATASTDIHTTITDEQGHPHTVTPRGRYLAVLSLTALGIVYGDIGTSPLYAMRECFHGPHAIAPTPDNIFGVLSLIFWALVIIISIKYCVFVLRADNRGEGGILALTALATPIKILSKRERKVLVVLGIFGAALLYGDGIITPAISVLGAIEGLNVATPLFAPYVVPLTIAILIGLFLIQSRGTAKVGQLFGPVMLAWFFIIALLGVVQIARHPSVVGAFNPVHAFNFFLREGWHGFLVLGTVFLVVTGGEALYADMGHFGKRPIRLAWFTLVLPALLLNYLGQGALLIENPAAAENPFYRLAPEWALYPLIVLASAAAIIASQALISGAFSLTMQAIQLGFMPRLKIEHTSSTERGQIYIPALNWALMIGCIAIVVGFGSSSNLAAAYGVAVTSTMVITTILLCVVAREKWGWSVPLAFGLSGFFLVIDLAFFGANVIKIPAGGWFPLVVGALIFLLMTTWKKGRRILAARLLSRGHPIEEFLRDIAKHPPVRVPGTAVFMNGTAAGTPPALMHNLAHNKVLHERVVLLTVKTKQTPHVEPEDRVRVESLGHNFYRMIFNYGFMEDPDIPKVLETLEPPAPAFDPLETTYFLGRETVIAGKHPGMMIWREKLFALMSRNASSATAYFCLPPNRVVELGAQVEI
ncbi:MAG: system potassium uptake protein [Pyrinomonadaceae bacterium]|jgi:KUP system potassium uptake protein|nr:system potassium uptake protein [Pyrinomonadaceae bacterium]